MSLSEIGDRREDGPEVKSEKVEIKMKLEVKSTE